MHLYLLPTSPLHYLFKPTPGTTEPASPEAGSAGATAPQPRPSVWSVYKQERALGSGTTSTVWLARHAVSGHVVAVKSIAKGRVDAGKWSALWAEVDVLRKVSCALSRVG